jgi:hypothetical protein
MISFHEYYLTDYNPAAVVQPAKVDTGFYSR